MSLRAAHYGAYIIVTIILREKPTVSTTRAIEPEVTDCLLFLTEILLPHQFEDIVKLTLQLFSNLRSSRVF